MRFLSWGIPKKMENVTFSWRPILGLALMLLVAFGLKIADIFSRETDADSVDENADIVVDANVNTDVETPRWGVSENTNNDDVLNDNETSTNNADTNVDADVETPRWGVSETDDNKTPRWGVSENPKTVNMDVPFISQAPQGIWDAVTEETCEEAALLMALEYLGITDPYASASAYEDALRAMVAREEAMGLGPSISAQELQMFSDEVMGVSLTIVEDPSVEELKNMLASGMPVIVPAWGRMLGNPFFSGEGPLYHMLVIRGYTETTFITNDPGTRRGEGYIYDIEVLMNAIGDWDGEAPNAGRRVLIVTTS